MKPKMLFTFGLLILLALPFVVSEPSEQKVIETDGTINPFGHKKITLEPIKDEWINKNDFMYQEDSFDYPVVRLSKTFLWIETDKVAEYKLTKSSDSIINAYTEGKAVLYDKGKLFDDSVFRDIQGKKKNLRDAKYYIWVNESYTVDIPEFEEACFTNLNKTETCEDVFVKNHQETKFKQYFKEYNFESLEAGEYIWKFEAKKERANEPVDFIPVAKGIELEEFVWWNSNWDFKKAIQVNTSTSSVTTYQQVMNITYDSDMQTDFDDIRFVNLAETTELSYYIETKSNSNWALVWVNFTDVINTTNVTVAYMYYGNAGASSNSNITSTFIFGDDFSTDTTGNWDRQGAVATLSWDSNGYAYTISSTGGSHAHWTHNPNITLNDNERLIGRMMTGTISAQARVGTGVSDSGNVNADILSRLVRGDSSPDNKFTLEQISGGAGSNPMANYSIYANQNYSIQMVKNGNDYMIWDAYNNNSYSNNLTFMGNHSFSAVGSPIVDLFIRKTTTDIVLWDYVFVAKFHGGTFAYSFGAEQEDSSVLINLISPANNSNFSTSKVNFTINATPTAVVIANVSLLLNGTYLVSTNTSGFNGTYQFNETLLDGDYNWTAIAYGTNGIRYNASNGTLYFVVDTTNPTVSVTYPPNGTNFQFLKYGNNLTLNSTVTDTHLSTCWYNYNFTNTTFGCTSGANFQNNVSLTNQKNITVWANDTLGNRASNTTRWTFDLFDFNNYTYDANVTESSQTTITGMFETGTAITEAYLQYNNTNNSVSIASLGNNQYVLSGTITAPSVVADQNKTWFFWVNGINATQFNQTVLNVNLGNCSTYTFPVTYYYLRDELTQVQINNSNSTIESLIELRSLAGELVGQFNNTYTGNSTPIVCSQTNLSSSSLRIWEQSRYGSTGYQFESHNVQNASITTPANFTLLDLPTATATVFRITYRSSTFLPVPDAVIDIQRKYIGEAIFKTVEAPLTDDNGEVSASLDLNAVIYRMIVRLNGTTLSTFENPAIACENPVAEQCFVTLNERQTINLIDTLDTQNDFSYGLNQSNRSIILTFEIPSGTSRNISLIVNASTILRNYTACVQYTLASSGQIQCDINVTLGDVFATVNVSQNGQVIALGTTTIATDRSTYWGTDDIVLTFFLVLSLALLMVSDAIATLVGLLIGLITSSLMLFLNAGSIFGATSVIMYVIIVVILLIVKIAKRDART